jgi:hypothetical protein
MYEVRDGAIDYAEEMNSVIVHFTKSGKPVLLEILDASKFLAQTIRATKGHRSQWVSRIHESLKNANN